MIDWFCVQHCRYCNTPFDWSDRRPYTLCQRCFDDVPVVPEIDTLQDDEMALRVAYSTSYDNEVVSCMVRRLKFTPDPILAVDLALWAEPACYALLREMRTIPHVVPVPLHWTRLWSRGYNQSQRIAEALCNSLGLPLSPYFLRRARRTKPHAKLDKHQRARNIVGAFQARPATPDSPAVIILDDVLTTGATLLTCAKEMRRAGYTHIAALTVARTM